jgi:hypothetical protein
MGGKKHKGKKQACFFPGPVFFPFYPPPMHVFSPVLFKKGIAIFAIFISSMIQTNFKRLGKKQEGKKQACFFFKYDN